MYVCVCVCVCVCVNVQCTCTWCVYTEGAYQAKVCVRVHVSTCTVHIVTDADEGAFSVKTVSWSSSDTIVDLRLTLVNICTIIDNIKATS